MMTPDQFRKLLREELAVITTRLDGLASQFDRLEASLAGIVDPDFPALGTPPPLPPRQGMTD